MLGRSDNGSGASSTRRVLIASNTAEAVDALHNLLATSRELSVETRVLSEREPDALFGLAQMPDLFLLRVDGASLDELDALAQYSPSERPPLIVIGDAHHPECMRAAMQVGARDYLTEPVQGDELLAAISRVASERRPSAKREHGRLIAFINGKGGSGATFLACNTAHILAEVSGLKTVLLGLDMQFASLPRYLDVKPKRGLLEALDVAHDLDAAAIDAYLAKHESGLALLDSSTDYSMVQQDMMTDRMEAVIQLLLTSYECCVVDLPRRVEPFTAVALEQADEVVLVLQQTIPSLHDSARMYELLTRNLAVPSNKITVAINRHQRSAAVESAHVQQQFPGVATICIPNDYRSVTDSINIGVPIYDYARRSSVTKGLIQLEKQLSGLATETDKGFFPRLRRTG